MTLPSCTPAQRGDGVDQRGIGAAGDASACRRAAVAADLDETRRGIVDAVFFQDQPRQLVGQRARAGCRKGLAGKIGDRGALALGENEAVVADRLPGIDGADLGAGLDRGQHIDHADEADVGIAGDQCAHRIGIAGDVDLFDLEVAEEALLLRDIERQRECRRRSGKYEFDFCCGSGVGIEAKHCGEAAGEHCGGGAKARTGR